MRLSKLTLTGFKSLADRTEFTFDEPITGVVGPNGCGKSNVVDAIKWVLGERSSKAVQARGDEEPGSRGGGRGSSASRIAQRLILMDRSTRPRAFGLSLLRHASNYVRNGR